MTQAGNVGVAPSAIRDAAKAIGARGYDDLTSAHLVLALAEIVRRLDELEAR